MLDWIFEGIVTWISSVVSDMMDAVSGLFLQALGTDMTAMEEYFPFVSKAFTVMQYTAWALLFLITVWQLFRVFGGPVTEAENPWVLLGRSALFAFLIGYAKPIFLLTLKIATAPYTALMDIQMTAEDFTFAGIEQALQNGLTSLIATISVVGLLLLTILEIALGWNYFKLLLETVERYIVVGVLCYTSPLAFSMGASKATTPVFRSWCRMVGSQLLLLVMNVWFLRGFSTSVGQYIGTGGALSNGNGNVFLWLFCAVAFLKTAQKFDSYLAAMGLNVAQTGSGMGMELLMAARVITGVAGGARSAGSVFRGGSVATGTGAAATGFAAGFANRFKGNSYVRDAVVDGGTRMGAGGTIGFVGRAFGGMAARNGATLTGESISSVASRTPNVSGSIGGDIANRSLGNYMPHMKGMNLSDTQITGGHISTKAIGADGKETAVEMFNASQFEKPDGPHAVVNASDGSQWYQMASGSGAGAFYDAPVFSGSSAEAAQVAAVFPDADGATLRTVGDGVIEASSDGGVSRWYNSAYYDEPDAPHSTIQASNGVEWYAMQQHAETPPFEAGDAADGYNRAQFQSFMPGYEQPVTSVDGSGRMDGHFEVRHENGSGTMFYDTAQYAPPRGDYQVYEDVHGSQWYAVHGEAAVERKPVYENGKPVYMFTSFEMSDDTGVLLGINRHNNSLCIVDLFDTKKNKNANLNLLGTSGAGKTFTMQLLALRMRMRGIQCYIIAPIKGHEFRRACNRIGGQFIKIAPGSPHCINIMEIRHTISPEMELIDELDYSEMDSLLAQKIQQLMIFFSLLIPNMTNEEEQMLDEALIRTYGKFGITHDNDSVYEDRNAVPPKMKTMPILGDLHEELQKNEMTKRIAVIVSRFVTGSAQSFNQQTNVDLSNKYIVLDLSELKGKLLPVGMMIALDYVWDKIKSDRTKKKAIMIDEIWQLIGAGSNRMAAEFCLEIFKVIRGFGGAAISATQDLSDFFGLEDGRYGRAIINNSKNKIILNLEPDEAEFVRDTLKLTKTEIRSITRFERGEALICSNNSKVPVIIKASKEEQEMITTDRAELEAILKERQREVN